MPSSSTSSPISINLTEDQIDDILFCARTNECSDLLDLVKEILNNHLDGKQTQDQDQEKELMTAIIAVAKTDTGNSAWHYAAANGHTETLCLLHAMLPISPSTFTIESQALMLTPNSSGNTPLHWASLNGHLRAVSLLISFIDLIPSEIASSIKSRHDEIHRKNKEKRRLETLRTAKENGEELPPPQDDDVNEEEREKEESDLRPLWDVPNKSGRGPMSEAQLGGHEELVKWLLERMVMGGNQSTSDERVEEEKDTPPVKDEQEQELNKKVEGVKLS